MSTGRICVRTVVFAEPEETARTAARRMAEHGVGALVVLGDDRVPAGVLTDRDLALRVLAEGRDPDATPVAAVMTSPPATVREETPIEEALRAMAARGIRRLVVVDARARIVGLLSLDDVLELLAEEMETVGGLLSAAAPRIPTGRPRA